METITEENTYPDLNIYVENETAGQGSVYEVAKKPYKLPQLQLNQLTSKSYSFQSDLPKVGISLVAISHDARFAASKNELYPSVVFVWDLTKLQLNSLIVQKHEIAHLTWCPSETTSTLNVSTGDGKLFLWTERVASVCQVPVSKENFGVQNIRWNPNGKSFAAIDKNNSMVFVYP